MSEIHYLPDRRPYDRGHRIVGTATGQCEQHGPYTANLTVLANAPAGFPNKPHLENCPKCNAIWQAEADARDAEIRGGMTERDRLRAAMIREAGIPERYKDCNVWHWQHPMDQQRRVWDVVRAYCQSIDEALQVGRCLVFIGSTGTGKTLLACGIVKHVVEKGGTARYFTVSDMVGHIRSTFSKDSATTEQEAIEAMAGYDLLVLDEVGRQTDSPHERETLFRVLDRRYANLRPVVLVTNLNPSELQKFLGQALIDRMGEAGGKFLRFDWPSHRSKRIPESKEDDA